LCLAVLGAAACGGSAIAGAGSDSSDSSVPDVVSAADASPEGASDAVAASFDSAAPDAAGDAPLNGGDAGGNALPLGTVTVTAPTVACPGNPGAGSTCMSISVSCPGIPTIAATVAVAEPAGGSPRGTIVAHAGGAGTGFFNGSAAGADFASAYTSNNLRFVQIAWGADWAQTGGVGIKSAACRPATAFQWMFTQIHGGSHTSPFCGTGSSGGSAAIMHSMAHYGLKNTFDYLVVAAGPAPARIDYGCDPTLYKGPALNLCPLLTSAPYAYVPGVQNISDSWEGTTSCGSANPSASNIAKWNNDSVWSPDGDYNYPQTGISYWFCVTTPNETTGQGKLLIDQLRPKNNPLDVHCYSGVCQSEAVFEDPSAFNLAVSEMTANCVPNH
jgi:hypothetical protein